VNSKTQLANERALYFVRSVISFSLNICKPSANVIWKMRVQMSKVRKGEETGLGGDTCDPSLWEAEAGGS
jgi:hypothetical protein